MRTDLPNLNDLLTFGFKECGYWTIQKIPTFRLNENSISNVLYAFATEEYVGYIGKSEGNLKKRLIKGYESINNLVYKGICQNIENLVDVIILYYNPESVTYMNIAIDIISGLEIPLAKKFKSQWNNQGYGMIDRVVDDIKQQIGI